MKKIATFLAIFAALFFVSSCAGTKHGAQHGKGHHHWSYGGETDPAHWAEIEKESDCGGNHQSPVNIIEKDVVSSTSNNLVFHYSPKTLIDKVINNGHSIQFNMESGNFIYYNGKEYQLKQLHFHEGSEHKVDGMQYPIEMHLVHVSDDGHIAVVGVLGKEGEKSQLFEFFDSFLPIAEGESKDIHHDVDLKSFLPTSQEYFSYTGSLTTPPCSENVNWILFKEPIILSVDEVETLQKDMPKNNYRPTQPLNDRKVYLNH